MATLASLRLVSTIKPTHQNPVFHRRNKLSSKIQEQILLAAVLRTVTNAEGDRVQVTHAKRVKPWWFVGENGKVFIEIRYGSKVIELSKGKSAIEIATPVTLVETLETVKAAVMAGELDTQIEAASFKLREGFNKLA